MGLLNAIPTPTESANRAYDMLLRWSGEAYAGPTVVENVLTDIAHFCALHGIPFAGLALKASANVETERGA